MAVLLSSRTWLAPRTLPTGADEGGRTATQSSTRSRTTSAEIPSELTGLLATIQLGDGGPLAREYEAANVIARGYQVSDLPEEEVLRADLERFLAIYRDTIAARDRVLIEQPGSLHVPTRSRPTSSDGQAAVFRPKDASDYTANVPEQQQRRTRKHEDLVRRFGQYARGAGWAPATNVHPRDLVLRRPFTEVMVEAKTVGNNAEFAVREAIGQLFAYRHFLYRAENRDDPVLLALFSEPVGEAFVALLETLGIEAAWFDDGSWTGSTDLDGLLQTH